MRDWGTEWVHAGWGKGGTDGSGFPWYLRHRTLSVEGPRSLSIGEGVCCLFRVTWVLTGPWGSILWLRSLFLGGGGGKKVYDSGLYPCSLCCNSGPYPWGGVLILGEFFLGLALINPLARRGGSARNVCMTYCPFFGEEFESVTLALIL